MTEVVLQQAPISAVDEKEAGHIHEKDDSLRDSHSHDGKDPVRNASVVKEITEEEEARYQWGVLKARAITSIWDNKSKWSLFVMLWFVSLIDQLLVNINGAVGPYMTSKFDRHGLTATVSIISSIFGGASHLTFAKIADNFGRVQVFLATLLLQMMAQTMKAASKNIETYMAGEVFYWTAHIGFIGSMDLIIADSTSLTNRMLMTGINGTPLIVSVFAGPKIAEHFVAHDMSWAFGSFAIILFAVSIPPVLLMLYWERQAFKQGIIKKKESGRTFLQSLWHYIIQFDVLGIFLISAAFSIFLLPYSLAAYAPNGWSEGYIIAMLVIGALLFPVFIVWEKYFAPVQFLKWEYIRDRTILGSSVLYGVMFMSTFIWNAYFRSYLQVVHRLSVSTADYTLNTYSLSSAFFTPFIGWLISATGRFKLVAYGGLPILLLGTALLIPFRSPGTDVGLIVMTQLFVGLGAGIWATCGVLAVMAPVTQQEIAVVLAIWGLFGSIGASTGFAIAGALWNNMLPEELAKRWPSTANVTSTEVFSDLVTQIGLADGTPERSALVGAYGYVQRIMVITGVALIPLCLLAIFIWKDVNVKKMEKEKGTQTKGNVV